MAGYGMQAPRWWFQRQLHSNIKRKFDADSFTTQAILNL